MRAEKSCQRKLERLRRQRTELMGLRPSDPREWREAVLANATKRFELAKELEAARLAAKAATGEAAEAYKEEERALRSTLTRMPPLDDPERKDIKLGVGKPPAPIELQLVRAERALEDARATRAREEERAGEQIDIDYIPDPYLSSRGQKVGHPQRDELGDLDRELRRYQRDYARIQAAPEKDFLPHPSGGRKPMPREVRLAKIQERIDATRAEIERRERTLSPIQMRQRQRKLALDERYLINRELREKKLPAARRAELEQALEAVQRRIDGIEG